MHLIPDPTRFDQELTLERHGDTLVFNGEPLDLSVIPEGATLPRMAINSPWIAGDITRTDGVLTVPLRLPHGAHAPEETLFPAPITLTEDGPVTLPAYEESAYV